MEYVVDAQTWPGVVRTPTGVALTRRARNVARRWREFCAAADIGLNETAAQGRRHSIADCEPEPLTLGPDGRPVPRPLTMTVHDPMLYARMAESGFLGFAESFLAGEWDADPLAEIIAVSLDHDIHTWAGRVAGAWSGRTNFQGPGTGELPFALAQLCAGPGGTLGTPQFWTGPSTTMAVPVRWKHDTVHVDVTVLEPPTVVGFSDIEPAQVRRVDAVLDECGVKAGSRVLEFPATSGLLSMRAARRGATVDVLSTDPDYAEAIRQTVAAQRLSGAINVVAVAGPIPNPKQWGGEYDAIVSVERMETLGRGGLAPFVRAVQRMLAPGGTACIQTIVDTGMGKNSVDAARFLRGYIWPAVEYPSVKEVREAVMRSTHLDYRGEVHCGAHLLAALPLWRREFAIHRDVAAAAGFDRVYRRMWTFTLALQEALVMRGELDVTRFVLHKRRVPGH